jgi:hypothetical protein
MKFLGGAVHFAKVQFVVFYVVLAIDVRSGDPEQDA